MAGTLFIVATPIGNLQDVTLRALDVLRSADLVACEDTRRTRQLLDRHAISARCLSYHKLNEKRAAGRILRALDGGENVALVSDGGTPTISDPGALLVARAVEAGFDVRPVPGPNAAVAALSACGLPPAEFTFHGFLPSRAGERRRALMLLSGDSPTQIFYEAPTRVAESLRDMAAILGDRRCCVVREMTKRFEQWYRGRLPEVAAAVAAGTLRGEFCVIVEGASRGAADSETGVASPASLAGRYRELLAGGLDRRSAIKRLAREIGLPRSEVYRRLVEERAERDEG